MLLWIEGFDAYGTSLGSAVDGVEEVYANNGALSAALVREGRLDGYAIELRSSSGSTHISTPNLGNISTIVIGFAFKPLVDLANRVIVSLREDDDATQGLNLFLNNTGTVSVRLNTTVLATTGAAVIAADVWHYIEFKVTVHNSTGSYDFKINGVSQLSASGIDTRAGTTNDYCNRVRLVGDDTESAGQGHVFDDWYICDTTGSVNNDFLGDRRVQTIFPSANGDSGNFATSDGGGSGYALVDDNPIDDDSTYVESSTSGHRDLYQFGNIVSADAINGIMQFVTARKTDVTNFNIELIVKSDSTISEGSAQSVGSTSYASFQRLLEQNPSISGAWTLTAINAAQFGYDVG